MFLILAIVLFAAWIGGFLVFKTAGILIHLLLILAVLSLIMNFVAGKRSV
ncbi:MAG: lmo0937 family membrane protein [Edaphobacter sp.]|nr:lmo0937 family membrane protein [Edaphobacter sp.]MDE1175531.1 lmo0937 family membrane protein [Edaphobacter sp.]